jgi:hypothetical protein
MDTKIAKIENNIKNEKRIVKIENQEDVEFCLIQNKRIKKIIDTLENIRLDAVREILLSKKRIDDKYKVIEAPLISLIDNNKTILKDYLSEQEAIKAKELKEDAGFNNKESNNLAKIETKAETGVSYRTDWDIEVIDINKVPDKYIIKSIDEKAIKEYLKEGKKSIPGLNCIEKKIIITK